jgi:hypothetical protein
MERDNAVLRRAKYLKTIKRWILAFAGTAEKKP